MRLKNKSALVLGASRGMGKQMALELARNGADVAVAARSSAAADTNLPGTITATAEEIRALGRRAEAIKVDLGNSAEVDAMVATALAKMKQIDILVCSVQFHGPAYYAAFLDTTMADIEAQMWVNTMSIVRTCRLILPHMIQRGGGTIVLVTSKASSFDTGKPPGKGAPGLGYCISKAALSRFVIAVAKEVKDAGVAVIGLNPGFVISEHVEAAADGTKYFGWDTSYGVPPTVPAKALGYLCTHDNPMSFTGQILESDELVAEHRLVPNPKDSYLESKKG